MIAHAWCRLIIEAAALILVAWVAFTALPVFLTILQARACSSAVTGVWV